MTSTTTTTASVDRKWFGGSLSKMAGSIIHECNRYDESFRTIHASECVMYSNKRKAVLMESDHTSNVYAFFARLCRDGLSVQHGLFPENPQDTTLIELSSCLMAQKFIFSGRILTTQNDRANLSVRYILTCDVFSPLRKKSSPTLSCCESTGVVYGTTMNAVVEFSTQVSRSGAETRSVAESALADVRDRVGHPNCVAGVMSRIGCGLNFIHGSQRRIEEDSYCTSRDDDLVQGGPPVVVTMLVALYVSLYTLFVMAPEFAGNDVTREKLMDAKKIAEYCCVQARNEHQEHIDAALNRLCYRNGRPPRHYDFPGLREELAAINRSIAALDALAISTVRHHPISQLSYVLAAAWPINVLSSCIPSTKPRITGTDLDIFCRTGNVDKFPVLPPSSSSSQTSSNYLLEDAVLSGPLRGVGIASYLLRWATEMSVVAEHLRRIVRHITPCMHYRINVGSILIHLHPSAAVDQSAAVSDALALAYSNLLHRAIKPEDIKSYGGDSDIALVDMAFVDLMRLVPGHIELGNLEGRERQDCILVPKKKQTVTDTSNSGTLATLIAASIGHACAVPQQSYNGIRCYSFSRSVRLDILRGRRGSV